MSFVQNMLRCDKKGGGNIGDVDIYNCLAHLLVLHIFFVYFGQTFLRSCFNLMDGLIDSRLKAVWRGYADVIDYSA